MSFHSARRRDSLGGGGGTGHSRAVSFDPTLGLEDARAVRDAAHACTHACTKTPFFV
jgi:hypothetical protein